MDGQSGALVAYEMTKEERYRFDLFLEVGFDPHSAERLALSAADRRAVCRAIGRGCSLELALEIFL